MRVINPQLVKACRAGNDSAPVSTPASTALVPSADGQTVYDPNLNVTWLADANLAGTQTFGVSNINKDGSMDYATALRWVDALNKLDHGTGYLAAAAVSDGLRRQADQGGTQVRTLSLARTAAWLTSTPSQAVPASGVPDGALDPGPWLVELDSAGGPVSAVAPPGRLGSRPLSWRSPLTGYGTDPAAWS